MVEISEVDQASTENANNFTLFSSRVTVAREATSPVSNGYSSGPPISAPRSSADARAAFDNLFKK